jgi:uncharacterized protein (DUF924 family)
VSVLTFDTFQKRTSVEVAAKVLKGKSHGGLGGGPHKRLLLALIHDVVVEVVDRFGEEPHRATKKLGRQRAAWETAKLSSSI